MPPAEAKSTSGICTSVAHQTCKCPMHRNCQMSQQLITIGPPKRILSRQLGGQEGEEAPSWSAYLSHCHLWPLNHFCTHSKMFSKWLLRARDSCRNGGHSESWAEAVHGSLGLQHLVRRGTDHICPRRACQDVCTEHRRLPVPTGHDSVLPRSHWLLSMPWSRQLTLIDAQTFYMHEIY